MNISDRIQSMRGAVGASYTRPSEDRVAEMQAKLKKSKKALDYLKKRGIGPDSIDYFKLGYDTSTTAISIPIYKNNELVNIKYRLLDNPEQRYSGESNAEPWMFHEAGLWEGVKQGALLIVEGEIDAISAWQAGIHNVISPSSGKDSFGLWLELLEKVKRVYIAYDNDEGGRSSGKKLAERIGVEKCYEVNYVDVKDANEFLLKYSADEFRAVLKKARPYISQQFKSMGDIIQSIRVGDRARIETKFVPEVKMQRGWMAVISGKSNIGKTSYVMNVANELAEKGHGVLVMPFERGIESVGERLLQVRYNASEQDLTLFSKSDWEKTIEGVKDLPVYFALPGKEEVGDFMLKAKRYLNTDVVIVDHLDYLVRQVHSSRGDAIMDTLQKLKRVAEDNGIILLIVSHIRKIEQPGTSTTGVKRPGIEDLKGSSSLYQDPEVVVMLSETENYDEVFVDVVKNKGKMSNSIFKFNRDTGVIGEKISTTGLEELWEDTPEKK